MSARLEKLGEIERIQLHVTLGMITVDEGTKRIADFQHDELENMLIKKRIADEEQREIRKGNVQRVTAKLEADGLNVSQWLRDLGQLYIDGNINSIEMGKIIAANMQ